MRKHPALYILGVGGDSELHDSAVRFVVYRKIFRRFCGSAYQHHKHPGRQRVKRTGVTDPPRTVKPTHLTDHIK